MNFSHNLLVVFPWLNVAYTKAQIFGINQKITNKSNQKTKLENCFFLLIVNLIVFDLFRINTIQMAH